MRDYSPASLPAISAVEVFDISGDRPVSLGERLKAGAVGVTVVGETALRIADLWRRLPPGVSYRCHTPPFGVRFVADGEVVCEATLCWQCHNAYGEAGGERIGFAFDARDAVSRALLAELRRAIRPSQ